MKIPWCITIVLCVVSLSRAVDFQGGSGVPDDPYQIGTAQQLVDMGSDPIDTVSTFAPTNPQDKSLGGEVWPTI